MSDSCSPNVKRLGGVAVVLALLVTCGRTEPLRWPEGATDGGSDGAVRQADGGFFNPDAGPKPCVVGRFGLLPAVPVVVLVLDRSGSMADNFSGSLVTKWDALREALRTALPTVDQTMQLGLLLYPVNAVQNCVSFATLNTSPATGQVTSIMSLLDSTAPVGGTPTASAIEIAGTHLRARRTTNSARAMELATDGAPTCNANLDAVNCVCTTARPCQSRSCLDDARSVARLANMADAGVPTYVIGIQSSNDTIFISALNAMAVAGGRPRPGSQRFYSATSAAELTAAFNAIRDQVSRCSFLTSSVPNQGGTIIITLNGVELPYDEGGSTGWKWTDRDNGELILQGSTCATVMSTAAALEAIVTCGPNP